MDLSSLVPRRVANLVKRQDGRFIIVENEAVLLEALDECGDDQIMFIPIIGSYQTGKSTFLSLLLKNNNIIIGDGNNEQTLGVEIIGPIDIRALKREHGIPIDYEQGLKIFFVDTQGYGGFTVGDYEENKINITRLISSFIPLSQVVIVYTFSNVSASNIDTLDEFFKLMKFCFSSFNADDMKIININRLNGKPGGISYRDPDEQKYARICQFLQRVQSKRFKIDIDKFVPFPYYDNSRGCQSTEFYNGFKYLVKDLCSTIDEISQSLHFDRVRIREIYEHYTSNTSNGSLALFSNISRKEADLRGLRKQINSAFVEVIEQQVNTFKSRLEDKKLSNKYPFLMDYKYYRDLYDDMKEHIDIFIQKDRAYENEIQEIYKYDIIPKLNKQCNEQIASFEFEMQLKQVEVSVEAITQKLFEIYEEEVSKINSYGDKSNYSFERYKNDARKVIEESIEELNNQLSFDSTIDEVRSKAEGYYQLFFARLKAVLDPKIIKSIKNRKSGWYSFMEFLSGVLGFTIDFLIWTVTLGGALLLIGDKYK